MAMSDYYICDKCHNAKVFYDADIDWEYQRVGEMKAVCQECAKTNKVIIVPIPSPEE